jgi:hypothetical protein
MQIIVNESTVQAPLPRTVRTLPICTQCRKLHLELTHPHQQLLNSACEPCVLGEAAGALAQRPKRFAGASSRTSEDQAVCPRHDQKP